MSVKFSPDNNKLTLLKASSNIVDSKKLYSYNFLSCKLSELPVICEDLRYIGVSLVILCISIVTMFLFDLLKRF